MAPYSFNFTLLLRLVSEIGRASSVFSCLGVFPPLLRRPEQLDVSSFLLHPLIDLPPVYVPLGRFCFRESPSPVPPDKDRLDGRRLQIFFTLAFLRTFFFLLVTFFLPLNAPSIDELLCIFSQVSPRRTNLGARHSSGFSFPLQVYLSLFDAARRVHVDSSSFSPQLFLFFFLSLE